MFGTMWSLFGGLSGNATQYYLTLILFVFYMIASFVCFLMSAWNLLKTNKTSKKVTLIITAIIALLGIGTFCYYQYFPDSARERASRAEEAEKGRSFPLKNDILYEDNDIIINIDKMYHYDNQIEIVFRLTNHSNIYYNFHINQVKANDLDILFSYKNPTKFSKVENWVDPDDYSDYYIMYISDYNLDNTINGIRELRKLSFQLKIYSNSFDGTGVKENITDYYDIVLR
jgi:hypothetical protein